jgi:hypothetical protein
MMAMESLYGRFKERFKSKYEPTFTARHDHFNKTPFKLEMANLGTTLTEWFDELKLDSSRFLRPDAVHHIDQTGFDNYEDDGITHAIGSDFNCALCGIPWHTMERFQMFINMLKYFEFIKVNPSAVANIQKDHQTFVRSKPRSCTSIHAIRTSYLPGAASIVEADDHPLLTFDNNRYICHLADDSAVHASGDMSSSGELSVHSNLFDPLIDFDNADSPYQPDMDEYLVANIVDDIEAAGPSSYEAAIDFLQNEEMETQEDDLEQGNAMRSSALLLVSPARQI